MNGRIPSLMRFFGVAISASLMLANSLLATPPGGGLQWLQTTPNQPSTPPRGDPGLNWLGEAIIRGLQQQPPPTRRDPLYIPTPQRGPNIFLWPEGPRTRPPADSQPHYTEPYYTQPPYQVQPSVPPRIVEPPRSEPLPSNVLAEPKPVIPSVPPQSPIWSDRVWEVSVREANCYAGELQQMAAKELVAFRGELGKIGGPGTALFDQLEQLQIFLQKGSTWRELEPMMQGVLEQNRGTFSAQLSERWRSVMRIMMVREAFVIARSAEPRSRGGAFSLAAIPTGIIFVVYDPLLPIGNGLFVSDRLMVCGGGRGTEFRVTTCSAAEGLGLPVAPGKPEPDISEKEANLLADAIVIRNPSDAGTAVNYVINSRFKYSIEPGHVQKLDGTKEWMIEFDRGDQREAARYTLNKGTYEFRIVSGRWDLVRTKYKINIDNRDGKQDFHYLMKNEVVTVKAGETQELESSEPVVVSFDRGEGTEKPARKNLNKSGTYKIAVDTDTNYLDLFATETS